MVVVTRAGGHFTGSAARKWPGRDGKGVLATGDTIVVVPSTRIYSAWWDRVMASDAKARVHASAARYIAAIA
jgi:hypothetical protein